MHLNGLFLLFYLIFYLDFIKSKDGNIKIKIVPFIPPVISSNKLRLFLKKNDVIIMNINKCNFVINLPNESFI